jgi:CheY-like chemotaxis protein
MRKPADVTVLVVDDDPDVTVFLATILEDAGMRTVMAHDGFEALERIRESPPDLISLDLVMPGKSGIRLLHELRKHSEWSRIPVIIVTGHARDEAVKSDLAKVLEDSTISGPSVYLEKPVTPEKYVEQICRILAVETATPPTREDRGAKLRRELENALRSADEQTLEAMLEALKVGAGKGGKG